eukprot:4764031-Pyramimonas_sp.AAC.1
MPSMPRRSEAAALGPGWPRRRRHRRRSKRALPPAGQVETAIGTESRRMLQTAGGRRAGQSEGVLLLPA